MDKVVKAIKAWFFGDKIENPLQQGNYFYRNRFIFLAFLTPFVLMLFGFFNSDFYPLGQGADNQVLVIDMWHQYFPFMNLFYEKLKGFESFFYSWDGALGFNFMGMMSYYASTPVYLLSVFFSRGDLTMAMGLFVIIKISCAGAFFAIYLRGIFKRYDMSIVIFSTLYALCAFVMGYYWCLMWLDVLALLPLVILGMIKLMDEGKFRMFSISIAFMIITNYYIAAMTCMFVLLYYFVLYFSKYHDKGIVHFVNKTFKVGVFALLGVGMSAIMLLPTFFALKNTYYFGNQGPQSITINNPIMDVLNNLLPNVKLTVRDGLPNIYCGMLSLVLAVLFLMCKSVGKREKVLNVSLLAFLILSFNMNKLDYIWHGLKFPNELPYRYSYVFSFVLITMAYKAFTLLKDITPKQIGIVAGTGFLYLALAEKLYKDTFDYKVIYIAILLLLVYCLTLMIYKTGKYKESFVCILIFLVVFAELANYTAASVKAVGNSNRTTYYQKDKEIASVLKQIKNYNKTANNGVDTFYRSEMDELFTVNPPALYNYKGVSQFNSMVNTRTAVIMQKLGYESDPGSNAFIYHVGTPVTESMLGINYLIGRSGPFLDPNYQQIAVASGKGAESGSTVYGYKFNYPLPVAYMVSNEIKKWDVNGDPFAVQNDFIRATTGISEDMFTSVMPDANKNEGTNMNIASVDENGISCNAVDTGSTSTAVVNYVVPRDMTVYAYLGASGAENVSVQTPRRTATYPQNRPCIINVGECKAGETVKVSVTFKSGSGGFITAKLRSFNNAAFEKAYSLLNDEGLKVTKYNDSSIHGTIDVKQAGTLFTSIPYEKGWSVKVDGKKVKVKPVGQAQRVNVTGKDKIDTKDDMAFVAIDNLKPGKHTITFTFVPEGFPLGFVIMLLSISLLTAIYVLQKRNDEKLKQRMALLAEMEAIAQIEEDSDGIEPLSEGNTITEAESGEPIESPEQSEPLPDAAPVEQNEQPETKSKIDDDLII